MYPLILAVAWWLLSKEHETMSSNKCLRPNNPTLQIYIYLYLCLGLCLYLYLYIKLRRNRNYTTKGMSEKCGSARNWTWVSGLSVGCLNHSATEPTTLATQLIIDLHVVRSEEMYITFFCNQDHLTIPRSIGDAWPNPHVEIYEE